MHSEALQDHCEQDDKGDDMTQVLIDRATLELVLRTLNRLRYDNDSVMAEEGFHEAAEALRAALANAEPTGWQKIETAPATANNVLAFSESGNMKIETGFWLINMLHAANIDGEKCNYTHWMPLPAAPGETP